MIDLKYMLDTSICIELLRGNSSVREMCIQENQHCCISVITAIELVYGAYNAPSKYRAEELRKARLLIDFYSVIGIDDVVEPFCKEKIRLQKAGKPIEDFDLLIGITALENDLTVVTTNKKHFGQIKGLCLANWA